MYKYKFKKISKKANFTIQLVSKNIYILNYSSHRKLCNAVMRFLSHVDLFPEISYPLSHRAFKNEYKKKHGSFSFKDDWEGFLIPSRALTPFINGKWNPLSEQEKMFLNVVKKHKGRYAVIGVSPESSPTTLKHEMAHALFEVNDKYKQSVLKLLKEIDLTPIFKILKKNGYNEHVFEDEAQAYLMNNLNWLKKEGLTKIQKYYEICAKLNFLFDKHISV